MCHSLDSSSLCRHLHLTYRRIEAHLFQDLEMGKRVVSMLGWGGKKYADIKRTFQVGRIIVIIVADPSTLASQSH